MGQNAPLHAKMGKYAKCYISRQTIQFTPKGIASVIRTCIVWIRGSRPFVSCYATRREILQARLEACRKLFFLYNGREHARIEREMRANGFPDFNRRCLYARGINSGWIEKHRWDRELLWKLPAASRSEPGAIATGSNTANKNEHERTKESSRKDAKPQRNAKNSKNSLNSKNSINSPTFHEWIKKVSPPMFDWDARHLKIIIKALQLVTEGKIKRLMIFMPPRHGKSELVTTRYTAWRLMMNPALKVILASYAQSLANRFSRNIRNTLAEHFALERVDRVDRVAEKETCQYRER